MIWQKLAALLATESRAALVTLVEVRGSAPREAGTRMIVSAEGAISGTIGGGALEWQALALAQEMLTAPEGRGLIRAFSLGPELGQCCGGAVRLVIEAFAATDGEWIARLAEAEAAGSFCTRGVADARGVFRRQRIEPGVTPDGTRIEAGLLIERHGESPTPLLLFGAGHVGRALVLALAPLPFSIRWIDTRRESFPAHMPANVRPVATPGPAREITTAPAGSFVLAMTHSHALDLEIAAAGLASPAVARIGVIGSATKRARFVSRLAALGIGDAGARLVCPVGMPALKDKSPAVIAAGLAVQLLEWRQAAMLAPAATAPISRRA